MDACAGDNDGVYTCEWHKSKGFWIDPPIVHIECGQAIVRVPPSIVNLLKPPTLEVAQEVKGPDLNWVYDVETRLHTQLAEEYRLYIRKALRKLKDTNGAR